MRILLVIMLLFLISCGPVEKDLGAVPSQPAREVYSQPSQPTPEMAFPPPPPPLPGSPVESGEAIYTYNNELK